MSPRNSWTGQRYLQVGPLGGGALENGISSLIRGTPRAPLSLPPYDYESQGEDGCPRTRKQALARHQIRRHLVLRLPAPELWELRSAAHKPVSLWSFYHSSLSWGRQTDASVLSQTRAAWGDVSLTIGLCLTRPKKTCLRNSQWRAQQRRLVTLGVAGDPLGYRPPLSLSLLPSPPPSPSPSPSSISLKILTFANQYRICFLLSHF